MKKDDRETLGVGMISTDLWAAMGRFLLESKELFVLMHSGRGPGKTYTTQKTVISDCLINNIEFCLTVPTIKQKENGALKKWLAKTQGKEFKGYQTKCTSQYYYMRRGDDEDWQLVGRCLALSEVQDAGKMDSSMYNVNWLIWDETMRINLDIGASETLLTLFLTAYHTIDRDENRVKAVFIGNNLNKTDPLFEFFGVDISDLKRPGNIKRSFNKIAWYVPLPPDIKDNPDNTFRKMINGTKYGDIADGEFYLSYGDLIGDPGSEPVTSCYSLQFTDTSYLLVMLSGGIIYVESCDKDFAFKYSSQHYTTILKEASTEQPFVPLGLVNMIRQALNAGKCKFVDEESLLIAAARLKMCFNMRIL